MTSMYYPSPTLTYSQYILSLMSTKDEPTTTTPPEPAKHSLEDVVTTQSQASTAIVIDVACPECDYNLRGLTGPIVDCPECGLTSDVPVLAARQWCKPWYRAPGFNTLALPAVLMCVGWFASRFIQFTYGFDSPSGITFLSIWGVAWCALMYFAYRVLEGYLGLLFALLLHPLVLGYLVSILGGILMIIWAAGSIYDGDTDTQAIIWWALWFVILLGVLWGCRRIERAIAMACIRHYLRRPTE